MDTSRVIPACSPPRATAASGRPSSRTRSTSLIIGGGPAGQIAAAQLAQFPGVTTRLDRALRGTFGARPRGRHAGAHASRRSRRSASPNRIVDEAYRITAMAFWRPIRRTPRASSAPACPPTIRTASASSRTSSSTRRASGLLRRGDGNAPTRMRPDYGLELLGLRGARQRGEHPVVVRLRRTAAPATARSAPCAPGSHRRPTAPTAGCASASAASSSASRRCTRGG